MQIGIVGSGNVGGTLGKRWAAIGHRVIFGSRHPDSDEIKSLVSEAGAGASAGTPAEAAECEVVLLATPWPATKQAVESQSSRLAGRVLIDAVNPILPDLSGLAIGTTTSAAEQVASWAPGAKVVKAFNTVGAKIMADPDFGGQRALMFVCGDDGAAKDTVMSLASGIGFDPQDAGALKQARLLEPLAMLWVSLAFTPGHGGDFVFQELKRQR